MFMKKAIIASLCFAPALMVLAQGSERKVPRIALYDTVASSTKILSAEAVSKPKDWTVVANTTTPFKGDAVLTNKVFAVVLRNGADAGEFYSIKAGVANLRGRLRPLNEAGIGAGKITSLKVTANDPNGLRVEATFQAKDKKKSVIAFMLKVNERAVKTASVSGAVGMRVEAPSRFGVLPDFFADDTVVDATTIPVDKTEVPSENFFMNMCANGAAIVTTVWDKNDRDVELVLSGAEKDRVIGGVDAFYGKGGFVWAFVLEGKGVWGWTELTNENAKGKAGVTFDWTVPFKAKWKCNLMRTDGTIDSWDFLDHPRNRSKWAGGIGRYTYPVWIDGKKESKAHIQPVGAFRGPVIAYPIGRTANTPLDNFTVVDQMRSTLGVGPCAYIMDVEGQKVHSKGLYTCAVYDQLAPLFAVGRQKDERLHVKRVLGQGLVFVTAIRRRIESFQKFGKDLLVYLAEQKKAHPEHAEFLTKMEALTKAIDKHNAKKVATPEQVGKWITDFYPNITSDLPSRTGLSLVGSIRGIGGHQDDLVARCRMEVKRVRQYASMTMAKNPKVALIAKDIRKKTQQILRGKFGHEGR